MSWPKPVRMLWLLVFAMAAMAAIQGRARTGGIQGFITDENGKPVPGAMIQACNIMEGGFHTAVAEADGSYKIQKLEPGKYSLWVKAKGHGSQWIPKIIVEDGKVIRQDVQLCCEGAVELKRTTSP